MIEAATALVIGGAILGFAIAARRHRLQAWEDAARRCGLEVLDRVCRAATAGRTASMPSRRGLRIMCAVNAALAGTEAGQLSLAQAEAGQLSPAHDPAGQVTLPPGERPE